MDGIWRIIREFSCLLFLVWGFGGGVKRREKLMIDRHTSPEGAKVVARAFAEAVVGSGSALGEYIQGL